MPPTPLPPPQANPIIFCLLTLLILTSGWQVVRQQNLFHAGINMITCFLGVAGIYLTLDTPFLAAMQVLVYAGAIAVVLLFAFMLTHNLMRHKVDRFQSEIGLVSAIALGGLLVTTALNTPWLTTQGSARGSDVVQLGLSYMTTYLVPLQLIAILLLITLMGAVVIARKEEHPPETPAEENPS